MIKLLIVLFGVTFINEINCLCYVKIGDSMKTCGEYTGFSVNDLINLATDIGSQDSKGNNFNALISCLWKEYHFVNENGEILYDNIRKKNKLVRQPAQRCSETPQAKQRDSDAMDKAIDYCEKHRPTPEDPVNVRKCLIAIADFALLSKH